MCLKVLRGKAEGPGSHLPLILERLHLCICSFPQSFLMNMYNVLLLCACLYCCVFSAQLCVGQKDGLEPWCAVHVLTDHSNTFSTFLWRTFHFDKLPPTAFHWHPAPFIVLYYGCMLHWDASVCGVSSGCGCGYSFVRGRSVLSGNRLQFVAAKVATMKEINNAVLCVHFIKRFFFYL